MVTKKLGIIAALSLVLAATTAPAHADTYVPGADNQTFATSPGGWTGSSAYEGLCLPSLLCPAAANGFVASGGAGGAGDGYIRTDFTSLVSTVAGTSTGTWESPAFTYNGNAGAVPTSVVLDLSIRPQVNALLGLSVLNDASYRVDLVDATSGTAISAVPQTALVNDAGWTSVPSAAVNPALLTIGRTYKTRITTRYNAAVTVVATGEVGYDNVRLTTSGNANGGGGGGGGGENGGSGITTTQQLTDLVQTVGLPATGKLVGNKLKIKIKCPAKAAPLACGYSFRGLAKGPRSKVATARKVALVNAGVTRWVKVKVKPRHLAKYKKADTIWIRANVRVGGVRVTVVKKVRLQH